MFSNMKNKIREKTGTDLPKFSTTASVFGKSKSNQHSRQSSQGSITSVVSDQSNKEEGDQKSSNFSNSQTGNSDSSKTADESIAKPAINLENKFHEKEKEWREKEKAYVTDLLKQTKELQEALSQVEEYKKKFVCCQEEKEQLEFYQKQEISKIKQLLLAKEEENNTNVIALKDALAVVDSLKQEVSRLKPLEEQINTCQVSNNKLYALEDEKSEKFNDLMSHLEMLSKENEALRQSNEESRKILDESLSKEIAKNNKLNVEVIKLKDYSQELAAALEEEKKVKDQTLLRNAEISQLVQLSEQELKEQQLQSEELFRKISVLESQMESPTQYSQKMTAGLQEKANDEEKLQEKIRELENEILDKNKSIRILQQNLTDVKKTFQIEFKNNQEANKTINHCGSTEDDINFKYMKHVLIKFLTSSEYEAQQLTKAVATLLKMNSEEERLIKQTLEWRSSWFGSKPRIKLHLNPS